MDQLWPEAISVYPQGLDTPGRLTDPGGNRSGWQEGAGTQGDRDLHFFDAMLATLEKSYSINTKRVYCTGHSNGAGFTYLLWRTRPDVFAAVAACSGAAGYAPQLTPKPAMILAGESDPLVKFDWTKRMIDVIRKVNRCDSSGTNWEGAGTIYPSKNGTPLVTYIYSGGHMMDQART